MIIIYLFKSHTLNIRLAGFQLSGFSQVDFTQKDNFHAIVSCSVNMLNLPSTVEMITKFSVKFNDSDQSLKVQTELKLHVADHKSSP